MDRADAVSKIEATYAPDSETAEVRAVGQAIMNRAREEVGGYDWRAESDEVLTRAAELCEQIDGTLGVSI